MIPDGVIKFTNLVLLVVVAVTITLAGSVCITIICTTAIMWKRKCEKHECLYACVYHNISP